MRVILTTNGAEPPLSDIVPTNEEKEATAELIRDTKERLRDPQTPEMPRRWSLQGRRW